MFGDSENGGWNKVLGGLMSLGLSLLLYWYLTDIESSGGSRRIHSVVAFLYNIGGKWLTCSVFGLLGVFGVWMGIKELKDE